MSRILKVSPRSWQIERPHVTDISTVWKHCHSHLRPFSEHLPLPDQKMSCPGCRGSNAFLLKTRICLADHLWLENSTVIYCPECNTYYFDEEAQQTLPEEAKGLPITAVNARLWSTQPTFLNIEPTTRCNFRCWYCIGRSMQQSDIRLEDFVQALEHFPTLKTIALVGEGEPLLHPDFFAMATIAHERGIKVVISSNGSCFTENNIRRLCESAITYVSVSIDSIHPQNFADSRPQGDLQKIWHGIDQLRAYRDQQGYQYPKIGLKGTLFAHTVDELPRIIEEAACHGMEIFESFQTLNPMLTYRTGYPVDKLSHLENVDQIAAKIANYSSEASQKLETIDVFCQREQIVLPGNGLPNGLRSGCDEQWIYSLVSGDVTPCCQIKQVINPAWNLFHNTIHEITTNMAYETLRFNLWNGIFPSFCSGCYKTDSH